MGTLIETKNPKVTYDEFLASVDEDVRAEWVDGEVISMSPVTDRHQEIAKFLIVLLELYLGANPVGKLLQEYTVKLGPNLPARVPDLIFLFNENAARNRGTYVDGPVDIAIEIVSLDSRGRDRGEKFYEYEQAGVREYWMIDPLRSQADFSLLGDDGKYGPASLTGGIFQSIVLAGLRINPGWFWLYPLPKVTSVLKDAGISPIL